MQWLAKQEAVLLLTTPGGLGLLVLGILERVWPTRPRSSRLGPSGGPLAAGTEPEPSRGAEIWFKRGRLVRVGGWSLVWMLFFWAFLLMGFPTETAKSWLAERLEQAFDARCSFEGLHIGWNLGVRLKGISIKSLPPESRPAPEGQGVGYGFAIRLDSLKVEPRASSLILGKPAIDFSGDTASGGHLSGSYISGDISFSFRDISFKDIVIAALPFPSSATMRGSGSLKVVTGNGTIDTEIDGIPGGRQKLKMPGGTRPAVDGKLKIAVSLPAL